MTPSSLEPGLAFLEGLALIASPCILPVLPLVLSASAESGKRRPFGIILGFVLAFSAFALASRKLIQAFGIDPGAIRNASLALLALFGVTLLSSRLSEKFSALTQGAANLGGRLSASAQGGFGSGIAIGALIGLVWTPCAGPILAAVLVQVIRQETDAKSLFIVVPFALGAGLPMLIIALLGRKIMGRLSFFTNHAEGVRKTFGVVILLAVAFIASGVDAQSLFSRRESAKASGLRLEDGIAPYPAPEFSGIAQWINSPPLTMQGLRGKVVLVDFWTYSCINCVRTLPYITAWDRKYRGKGLVIVGVHSPEFAFEQNPANVKAAVAEHGIRYPVALDNNLDTWSAFHNEYWPAQYLINREGYVVYTHFGEGGDEVTENNIRYLLGLRGEAESAPAAPAVSMNQTPETYLGYARAERFDGATTQDTVAQYRLPKFLPSDHWALGGKWKIEAQKIVSAEKGAALELNFTARKVFLVLGTATGKPVSASIILNGEPASAYAGKNAPGGRVTVNRDTLYELIDRKQAQNGLLELIADAPGLEAYAFTFGE